MCVVTHWYLCRESFGWITDGMQAGMHSYVGHDSITCVTWLIYTCGMTHSDGMQAEMRTLFICVTWLIHICNMTHLNLCHDSFRRDASLFRPQNYTLCDMIRVYYILRHDSLMWAGILVNMNESCLSINEIPSAGEALSTRIHAHMNESRHTHKRVSICVDSLYVCRDSFRQRMD